jgi:Bromodomain
MDITTIQNKTIHNEYTHLDQFCLDVRQVFANALIYNTNIKDSLRPLAVQVLDSAEMLLELFLRKPFGLDSYQPLLYCWKLCIDILDTLYNLVNPAAKDQSFAFYFSYPVAYYCGGNYPPDYLQKVQQCPMDFGTVTEKLVTGVYQTVEAFCLDCERIIANCRLYYAGRDDGTIFLDQAEALDKVMKTQLNQLRAFDRKRGPAERQKLIDNAKTITARLILPKRPPPALYWSVLEELRAQKYTDKATKITEPATGPFEDLPAFADYTSVIAEPLDLKTVAQKAATNGYDTPEDFEYDVLLVFKNAEQYNAHRGDPHSVQMARYGLKKFKSIFYSKMAAFDDPDAAAKNNHLRISINVATAASKSAKTAPSPKKGAGNLTPRTPVVNTTTLQQQQQQAKAKQQSQPSQSQQQQQQPPPLLQTQPVPLHIAIAKVKEAFPLRRALKSLQSWEADCARFFKELMRHPWITTVRPKFIFHVPVPMLFPELKGPYEAKIRQPMDLTTIECTLLAGNRYASPEAFVSDVALVFANSILFNKDGKDVGDLLSCAYYDASVHLLRYVRWLSHELLLNHVSPIGHTDLPSNGLPPFSWQLTVGNRKLAHQETESIVMKEPLEKSVEGDRYTWMETECEKLLKAIRHQSDQKYMKFFIQTIYPPDYTAFISKPMDWDKVQKTLKKRQYDTIGQMADDLRLIFSNALKYNARHKDFDAVSNEAYQAAEIMSEKLEAAINKMLLSVADRLERERIDHANAEREIDAAERAEEAEFRATWKKEGGEGKDPPEVKIRMHRRGAQRQAMDFEVPFFDEEETTVAAGSHHQERSFVEVIKFQKGLYEKQRKDKLRVRSIAMAVGTAMLERTKKRQIAQRVRAHQEAAAMATKAAAKEKAKATKDSDLEMKDAAARQQPPSVLKELERADRVALQLKLNVPTKKKSSSRKRKRVVAMTNHVFGGDDSDSE